MKIINSISEMKTWSHEIRSRGNNIGFVPTMGYLHEGHLSLIHSSIDRCDKTVVSIFVNPTQFAPGEDLDTYPHDLQRDQQLLSDLKVDVLFFPDAGEMYPDHYRTFVNVEEISSHLCGKSRPGFFRGVTTIVLKLFHIVQPDVTFFGEKDRQQLEVIRRMTLDLNLDIEIAELPIVREPDGLARSSRNTYLNSEERLSAQSLSQALESGKMLVLNGEHSAEAVRRHMRKIIESEKEARVDYISVCDPKLFTELQVIDESAVLALAVHIGKTRLIDNCLVERKLCNESC